MFSTIDGAPRATPTMGAEAPLSFDSDRGPCAPTARTVAEAALAIASLPFAMVVMGVFIKLFG